MNRPFTKNLTEDTMIVITPIDGGYTCLLIGAGTYEGAAEVFVESACWGPSFSDAPKTGKQSLREICQLIMGIRIPNGPWDE